MGLTYRKELGMNLEAKPEATFLQFVPQAMAFLKTLVASKIKATAPCNVALVIVFVTATESKL